MEELPYDKSLDLYDYEDEPVRDENGYTLYGDEPTIKNDLEECACDGTMDCLNSNCRKLP